MPLCGSRTPDEELNNLILCVLSLRSELLGLDPQLGLLPVLSFPLLGIASALALSSIPNELSTNNLTYIRLNLGLLMWQVGSLAIWLVKSAAVPLPQCWPLWIAKLCVAIPIIVTSSISLSSIRVEEALIQSQVPTAVRRPLPLLLLRLAYDDLTESLSLPNRKTAVSRYLGFSQLLTIAVGGSFAFSPRAPIPLAINPSDVNVSEIVSSANETLGLHLYRTGFGIELMFLLGTVQWILADAEERGWQGSRHLKSSTLGPSSQL